jgi:Pregnancy-associated plasma protein-A/GEVED domain/Secretion system C-terminal sorting domain
MKSNIPLTFFTLLLSYTSFTQDRCAFDILHKKKLKEDPAYRKGIESQALWIKQYISNHQNELMNRPTVALYTIPVVVHVVHTGGAIGTLYNPTDAQIQNTITYLNQVYDGSYPGTEGVGDVQIQFTLAQLDPNCNATTGINRVNGSGIANYVAGGVNINTSLGTNEINVKNLIRWDPSRYYNIWVVNRIDGMDGTSGTFFAGYAYFPGASAALDGTVMLATQMQPGRKTLPHEVGHALSLYHPFEGAGPPGPPCPANTDCTSDGDEICDTDPITQPAGFVCRTGNNTCTGTPYLINTEHNYMNYTNCATLFTADQKTRMLASAIGPFRIGLTTSRALSPAYPLSPFTQPPAASCTPTTSPAGLTPPFGAAGIMNLNITNRNLSSGPTAYDGGYLPSRCLNLVELQRGNTYNFSVTLLGTNRGQLRFWIDYDNNGVFSNLTEQIFYQADINPANPWNQVVSGSFTVPLTATINTTIRMRLIDEVSTVYGIGTVNSGCYNPAYGQGEDYPVYILAEAILPVKMEFFKVKNVNGTAVLDWKTSFEQNADKFIIEKSFDGSHFVSLNEIKSKGARTGNVYNYVDRVPGAAELYYRLNQVDLDGKSNYSEVVMVRFNNATGKWYVLNNPFNQSIELSITEPLKYDMEIRLIDMTGRIVHDQIIKANLQKQISVNVGTKNIEKGVYVLQIRYANEVSSEKLIKQ